jgi:hypothetical protein
MKNQITLILLLISQVSLAQNQKEPIFYLNNVPISIDSVFLDPNSLQSINVKKETPMGEIYMTTKDQPWDCYSLDSLLKTTPQYAQIIDTSIIPVFIINGKVINKKSDTKIDKLYFAKVSLGRLSNVSGLSGKSKKIVIINIELTNKDPRKEIRVIGDSIPDRDN